MERVFFVLLVFISSMQHKKIPLHTSGQVGRGMSGPVANDSSNHSKANGAEFVHLGPTVQETQ